MTGAGLRESHPHQVQITKEAPNYSLSIKIRKSKEGTSAPFLRLHMSGKVLFLYEAP